MEKVEIYILSGFLGAGKTTLLQQILKKEHEKERKVAVIMNEMGLVSIDSDAISEKIPLKELLNGCVCCTLSYQLEVKLSELINQYELDAIYIKTTGVAHPVEVLDACLSPLFAEKVKVQSIITILDALRWSDRHTLKFPLQKLITEQVKHADIVLLNKIDKVLEEKQKEFEIELQSINPKGKIIPTKFANINPEMIRNLKAKERDAHQKAHAIEHLHIKTYVHTFSQPIDKKKLEDFLRIMPESIYRIKGYIRFTGTEETYLLQYAYGMPLYSKIRMKMKNTLVFIGDELDHNWLQTTLTNLQQDKMPASHSY
ncbi:CobW family GTP-binding protein [Bacillus methanolicus]|uniref:Putative GTPase (G3E family)-like protein n=1 Tax=Bacillus methanolicus (strain MGA3 / ATCC 53907) TaxID=796606 RepID=I3E3E5_BACMM|nr:GTP-binding protein [Bacillus methanolicus]AIE58905.1 putative GTPase (G3E family)-like protein [Bacillus methanolicus MGA3]EIJ81016.1 cobalamin synthesis protein/P47K family protein [Bacillus methanolicus MGA3]